MKKLIFIDIEPLTPRRVAIFKIEELRDLGFEIEYWDMSQYFDPGKKLADTLEAQYVRYIRTIAELHQVLEQEDTTQVIFSCEVPGDRIRSHRFFRTMKRHNTIRVRIDLYATAALANTLTLAEKLRHATFAKIIKSLITRIEVIIWALYRRMTGLKLYHYLIRSGQGPHTDVHINHPDWELYNETHKNPPLITEPYALFLDEFYPLHPDIKYHNRGEQTGGVEQYQSSLRRFFDTFEQQCHLHVVVAAHPKAEYAAGTFGSGREIIKYRSAQLVKDAAAVFMHNTASVAFAIMNDRPLALITNDSYNRQITMRIAQQRLAKTLGLKIYNLDHCDLGNINPQRINPDVRNNYIYSYLTSPGIEETPNIEILDTFFCNL